MTASYLDFDLEIGQGRGREYPVTVRSPAGEARETMQFPFDQLALKTHLLELENALLRSGGPPRRALSAEQQAVQMFGQALFDALITGEIRSRFDASQERAAGQDKGLRLRLHFLAPELSSLPWEFLYDRRNDHFLSLFRNTPVVRYLELPQRIQPLTVEPPLRILGVIASPKDLPPLNEAGEKRRIEEALKELQAQQRVILEWLPGNTWRDLQRAMRAGPWHVLHFVGHGRYNEALEEGVVYLKNEAGYAHELRAHQFAQLLANHTSLRLVVMNSCESAKGSPEDVFSSTASIMVRQGIAAVIAMQHEITDQAAIELSRVFYEALADGYPVDAALAEARVAVSVGVTNTVEWGTPVLTTRAPDGALFELGAPGIPGVGKPKAGGARHWPRWTLAAVALVVILIGAGVILARLSEEGSQAKGITQATVAATASATDGEPSAALIVTEDMRGASTAVAAATATPGERPLTDAALAATATAAWSQADDDADGLTNSRELTLGTLLDRFDSDGDGLDDGEEFRRGTAPMLVDSDQDGLTDGYEVTRGLDPLQGDTDGDGAGDGVDPDPLRPPAPTPLPTTTPPENTPTPLPPPTPTVEQSQVVDDFEGGAPSPETGFEINRNAGNSGDLSLVGIPHVNRGSQALAFAYNIENAPPNDYVGFDRVLPRQDWSPYNSLCFWIESDGSNRSLVLQFGESKYKFWKQMFSLSSGTGDYCLALDAPHQIDLRAIGYYGVYVAGPPQSQGVIYVDNVRVRG